MSTVCRFGLLNKSIGIHVYLVCVNSTFNVYIFISVETIFAILTYNFNFL